MAKDGFLKRHGIVRNAIINDLLYFAIPAIAVASAGMVVSTFIWRDGLVTPRDMFKQRPNLSLLSTQSMVGVFLFVIGFATELVGQITIGRSYSSTLVIREDHKLVTHGIYHYIRHPIYLGVILAAIGIPMYSSSLAGILIMSALIPIFLIRIKFEERMLTDEFGDVYLTYKKSTRKLIPFLF